MRKALRILKKRPTLVTENNIFSGGSALHGFCAWGCGFDRAELKWLLDTSPKSAAEREQCSGRGMLPLHLFCRSAGLQSAHSDPSLSTTCLSSRSSPALRGAGEHHHDLLHDSSP